MGRVSSSVPKRLFTTIGDLVYASAVSNPARLASVASEQVLTAQGVGAAPAWAVLGGKAGEGHITILGYNHNSVGQGTWAINTDASQAPNFTFNNNAAAADLDNISYLAYLAAGTYTLRYNGIKDVNVGIIEISIDAVVVATFDMYAAAGAYNQIQSQTAIVVAASGLKTIKFALNGKNASSSGYRGNITMMALWRTA